jgi:hypothetical protein
MNPFPLTTDEEAFDKSVEVRKGAPTTQGLELPTLLLLQKKRDTTSNRRQISDVIHSI